VAESPLCHYYNNNNTNINSGMVVGGRVFGLGGCTVDDCAGRNYDEKDFRKPGDLAGLGRVGAAVVVIRGSCSCIIAVRTHTHTPHTDPPPTTHTRTRWQVHPPITNLSRRATPVLSAPDHPPHLRRTGLPRGFAT